jgi:NADH-quinone oxidoreductase subunit N
MSLFLVSLIGIPPTPGFSGKWELFFGAFALPASDQQAHLFRVLALIGAINAAVASWYYLRLITVMYLRTPLQPLPQPRTSPGLVAVTVCAALTLLFCYPRPLFDKARAAIDGKVQVSPPTRAERNSPADEPL